MSEIKLGIIGGGQLGSMLCQAAKKLKGLDSLLSIAQMPKGIPVGTLAIGEDGAINAALLAASILANSNKTIKNKLKSWRLSQTKSVKKFPK